MPPLGPLTLNRHPGHLWGHLRYAWLILVMMCMHAYFMHLLWCVCILSVSNCLVILEWLFYPLIMTSMDTWTILSLVTICMHYYYTSYDLYAPFICLVVFQCMNGYFYVFPPVIVFCICLQSSFTWRHSGHIGVPKQWNGSHVSVPNKSCGSRTLFLWKRFLLFY